MCDPIGIASGGFAVAQGATSIFSQRDAYKQQIEANRKASTAIGGAAIANYGQLQLRSQQEITKAEDDIQANALEALRRADFIETAAGDAGVGGLSVQALVRDIYGQRDRNTTTIKSNLNNIQDAITVQMENIHRGAQSDINALPQPRAPNYLGTAFQTGGALFGAYQGFKIRSAAGRS